jgi:uncharacterized protein YjbJ (UPF0337 family)
VEVSSRVNRPKVRPDVTEAADPRRDRRPGRSDDMEEKAKGRMKEAAGAVTGDEDKKAEGQAQQRKASAREEREQQKRTKAEQNKVDRAEKSRDKQERKDRRGLLGNVRDSLSGR